MPYFIEGWWKFLIASLLILFLGNSSLYGLRVSKRQLIFSGLLLLLTALVFRLLILSSAESLEINYATDQYVFIWSFALFFQVLNEEMLLRGALLNILSKYFRSKLMLILLPAVIFTVLHYLFYASQKTFLNSYALSFILLFGITANMLFIKYQHIWFGFALHLAWNLTRFTGVFSIAGVSIAEGETSNYIEGNINNLGLIVIMFITTSCLFIYNGNSPRKLKP